MFQRPKCKRSWRFLLLTMVLLAAMLSAACQSATPQTAAPTAAGGASTKNQPAQSAAGETVTVKVGFHPIYSGPMTSTTEPISQGMEDYFSFINDQGGLSYKDPKTGTSMRAKLDVVSDDNGYDAQRLVSNYQRQKQAGVKAMLLIGTHAIAMLPDTISKDKMPIAAVAGPNEAALKVNPNYFTTLFSLYDEQGKSFAKWVKDNWKESRAPRLGIVHSSATYGQAGAAGLAEYAKSLGWEVLNPEPIKEPVTDSSIQVKRLMDGNPDWVYTVLVSGSLGVVMKDVARLGYKDKAKWVAFTPAFDTTALQQVADAETDGVYSWLYWAVDTEKDLPGVREAEAASQKYRKSPASMPYISGWGLNRVFLQGGLKSALEKVGYDALTGEAINTALHNMANVDSGGIFPPVSVTEDRPYIGNKARLVQWKDHQLKVLSDWQVGTLK